MIVKIDLEKAYDRIEWDFLKVVLQEVGFSEMLIKVILSCIKSTRLEVIWNKQRLDNFVPQRGLR